MAMIGVNLGGWLVPEAWLTPSLTRHPQALRRHFETFITPDDIAWLAMHGVQAVRIPVPYKVPFAYTDPIIAAAGWHGMRVIIDIHTAPGSQNGWEHSGRVGEPLWHTDPHNIAVTLDAVTEIAEHYSTAPNVWGIEVLNEPRWDVPHEILVDYYKQAYARIRTYCPDTVAVIVSDAFRMFDWAGVFPKPEFTNVILDAHLYQCFSAEDKALSFKGHLQKTAAWHEEIGIIQRDLPVMIGEWSGALDPQTFEGWDGHAHKAATKQYIASQQQAFEPAVAQFYWTYKSEKKDDWNFRHCLEAGLLRLK